MAERLPGHRFQNLFGLLTESNLTACWRYVRKNAAGGVDRVSAREYGAKLSTHVPALVERVKSGRYRARLVLRKWIPKSKTKRRPLGLPVVEDKLLQTCVSRILNAIFEADFLPWSHGYRKGRGARSAALIPKRRESASAWAVPLRCRSGYQRIL